MSDLTPADLLDKAAEHIEIIGWHQGDYTKLAWSLELGDFVPDEECPACAVGAINIAANAEARTELEGDTGTEAAARALAERLDHDETWNLDGCDLVDWIGEWNDAKDRTAEQVVTELRACAAELRQGEGQ